MPEDAPTDPSKGDGKTFTQDELDRIVADRLKREQSKYSDYADLKAKADKLAQLETDNQSEVEKLSKRLQDAEQRASTAESRADRFEVALSKGLDMTLAKRLAGTTREELEADADELQTWKSGNAEPAAPSKPTEALSGGGDPTEEPAVDIRQIVESIPRGF